MALKPDRDELQTDISYIFNTAAERGGVACANTGTFASGAAMDSTLNVAFYPDNPSGCRPIGCLMNDFVNIDLARQKLNQHKDEAQVGMKACILRKGWVVTNMLASTAATGGQATPTDAYVGFSGYITNASGPGLTRIGEILTRRDADGYAKVKFDC